MPMLSPLPRRTAKRGRKAQALTPLAIVGNTVEARLAGVVVTALPEGALWVDEAKTLIVSDLHLEKGSAFARRGQYANAATLLHVRDVNGALVARETLIAAPGRAGIALLNYEDVVTHCAIGDLWVWPLVSEGGDE